MPKSAFLLALVVLVVLSSCSRKPPTAKVPVTPAAVSEQLRKAGFDIPAHEVMSEDFTLESLDGGKISLSSYRGKVVLLSFWATWCGPCKEEMPSMQSLYLKLRSKGFEVVAVDMMEDKATVAKFVKTSGYTFPVLLDSTGSVGGGPYAARAIPTNYIVDKAGKLVARKVGIDGPAWTSDERVSLFDVLLSQ